MANIKVSVQAQKDGGGGFNSPRYSKQSEKDMAKAINYMLKLMAKIYKNQVLLSLNKKTIQKFEDAQTGNFAKIFTKLAAKISKNLIDRFSDNRLGIFVNSFLLELDDVKKKEFYNRISREIGIPTQELINKDGMFSHNNALRTETFLWIKRLRDDTLSTWTASILRSMSEGNSLDEVMSDFSSLEKKSRQKARFIARNQIATYQSLMAKARANRVGITEAYWQTSEDERVRECHQRRNGKRFNLKDGLYSSCDNQSLLPGIDYNCRCGYVYIIPGVEQSEDE